jgi:hypothetical protein
MTDAVAVRLVTKRTLRYQFARGSLFNMAAMKHADALRAERKKG